MNLVIKIDDKLYDRIKYLEPKADTMLDRLMRIIQNGTPLPKGHGDLIDRRELKKEVYTTTEWNGDIHRIIYEASVDAAKPIIEADKESE